MPRVYKKTYSRPIPDGAERVTVVVKRRGRSDRVDAVRFRGDDGKLVTAPLTVKGARCLMSSPSWYGRVGGKPVRLCSNKCAAELMLGDMVREAANRQAGIG